MWFPGLVIESHASLGTVHGIDPTTDVPIQPLIKSDLRAWRLAPKRADIAPCHGRILSRDVASTAALFPTYTVELDDDVILSDVTCDQLFTYVTPEQFEAFEHECFRREIAALKAARHAKREFKFRRHAAVSSRKTAQHITEDTITADPLTTDTLTLVDTADTTRTPTPSESSASREDDKLGGREGRPRPSYKHMYPEGQRVALNPVSKKRKFEEHSPIRLPRVAQTAADSVVIQDPRERSMPLPSCEPAESVNGFEHKVDEQNVYSVPEVNGHKHKVDEQSLNDIPEESATEDSVTPVQHTPRKNNVLATIPEANLFTDTDWIITGSSSECSSSTEEGIYEIEEILEHHMSDPKTHSKSAKKASPVMLYRVKWLGYDEEECTWEPEASFDDNNLLEEYWAGVRAAESAKYVR